MLIILPSALLALRPHAECFISHKAQQGNECFNYLKEFPENALIKTCLLVHCNLNGGSLIHIRASLRVGFLIARLASC